MRASARAQNSNIINRLAHLLTRVFLPSSLNLNVKKFNLQTIKFLKGSKYYIIAFVSNGSNFKPIVLENGTAKEAKYQGLAIARKGEMYGEIINEDFDRVNRRLKNDAPVGGTCEASTYYYIYKNGAFKRAFTSD